MPIKSNRPNLESLKFEWFDLLDKHFPKGECKERGQAMVLLAEMLLATDRWHRQSMEKEKLEAQIRELEHIIEWLEHNILQSDQYKLKIIRERWMAILKEARGKS